jgi:hypothetical protein
VLKPAFTEKLGPAVGLMEEPRLVVCASAGKGIRKKARRSVNAEQNPAKCKITLVGIL